MCKKKSSSENGKLFALIPCFINKIDNNTICHSYFSWNNYHIAELFEDKDILKNWADLKAKHNFVLSYFLDII